MNNKKNILIFGGSGFIGTNVLNYYTNKNYNLFATYYKTKPKINNSKIKWLKADLLNENSINKIFYKRKINYVIQCAAATAGVKSMQNDPFMFISGNAIMNSLIIKLSVKNKVNHFIFLSCTVMYHHSKIPLSEKDFDPNKKIHPSYEGIAYTKTYIENLCKFYSNNSNTKFTALRHSNIYGPYDKFNTTKGHFMSSIISKVFMNNETLEIWGSGKEKRDFLYIDDFLRGIQLIFSKQKNKFEIFNMSYGHSYHLYEVINKIISNIKSDKNIKYLKNQPTIKVDILIKNKKIFKSIGWKPTISLDSGIKKTIKWYKKYYQVK